MTPDPIDRTRLAEVRRRAPKRLWLAILAALGVTGGAVVVVDQTRDRIRVDPPPVVDTRPDVRPPPVVTPPRGDEPSVPPSGAWPVLTSTITVDQQGGVRLDKHTSGVDFVAVGPTNYQGQMVLLMDYGAGLHTDYTIDDCMVRVMPGARRHWGLQGYDAINLKVRRSKFMGQPGSEHGMYVRAPQDLLVENCHISGWGGAGIQVAFRRVKGSKYEHESSDHMLASVPSKHIYRRVTIEGCGDPTSPRFGAYLLSEHAPEISWDGYVSHRIEADVIVDDCVIRGGNLDMIYKDQHIRSTRGLLVQNRPSLTVTRSVVDVPQPMGGWNSQVWGVDHVVLRDSEFNGGTIEIRWAKSVTIENCRGTANVIVGGGKWNVWPMTGKIHDAPITANWTWSE